jgi:hypothetical protein
MQAVPDDVRQAILQGSAPVGLSVHELDLHDTQISALPAGLRVDYRLDLTDCAELKCLPDGLKACKLILHNCRKLRSLPEGLETSFLDISGCTGLESWPQQASVSCGWLNAAGCAQITDLPSWLANLSQLNLQGCAQLTELPLSLHINSWIDIAGSGITSLPPQLKSVHLRWRGVLIDERIAFHPETITGQEILEEPNAERRRVLLERMGYEAFLKQTKAEVLDQDVDAGGIRRLFRVPMPNDEDLVCVSVICPSTARQYILRVPPTMTTCRQAIAWTAGFDDPEHYKPFYES